MKIIDITLPITSGMVVYPGNAETELTDFHKLPEDSSNSTLISMGSHNGTHVDAPKHISNEAKGIEGYDLKAFVGRCRVLDMTHVNDGIGVEDLEKEDIAEGERILVKTRNSKRGFDKWRDDYIYLSGDGADYLAEKGIVLFGVDALSVKQRGSKDTRAHDSLLSKNIVIFEGLDLSGVTPGKYTFVGLPLKIEGRDGAPARVILMKGEI